MRLLLPLFVLIPRVAQADACDLLFTASEPPPPSACLQDRANVIVAGLIGYAAGGEGSKGVTGFARIDVPLGPLWLEARGRYHAGGDVQLDALAGIVLSHRHGPGRAWFTSNIVDTPGTRTTTYTGRSTVLRKDLVLAGGLKMVVGKPDEMSERTRIPMAALGLQHHTATGFGSHAVIEAFALYGDSKAGGVVAWHNSIPPTKGIVFGMEAGLLPGDQLGTIYWAMVEIGISFER